MNTDYDYVQYYYATAHKKNNSRKTEKNFHQLGKLAFLL